MVWETMKLYVVSDLHLEFGTFSVPNIRPDVVILAGDIHVGAKGIEWALSAFPTVPVLYIVGNHELYGYAVPKLYAKLRSLAQGTLLHVLENDSVCIGDVTFYGCTLWSDFALFGNKSRLVAMEAARQHMTDFRRIRVSPKYSRFCPDDAVKMHYSSKAWLLSATQTGGKKVVITHHAPSARSLAESRKDNLLSAAYASHCDALVAASQAVLWIHGHTHCAADYALWNTRVLSNPRGYVDEPVAGFQPSLVVEI